MYEELRQLAIGLGWRGWAERVSAQLLLRGQPRVVTPGALLESGWVEIQHANVARCLRKQQRAEFAKVTNLWVCA